MAIYSEFSQWIMVIFHSFVNVYQRVIEVSLRISEVIHNCSYTPDVSAVLVHLRLLVEMFCSMTLNSNCCLERVLETTGNATLPFWAMSISWPSMLGSISFGFLWHSKKHPKPSPLWEIMFQGRFSMIFPMIFPMIFSMIFPHPKGWIFVGPVKRPKRPTSLTPWRWCPGFNLPPVSSMAPSSGLDGAIKIFGALMEAAPVRLLNWLDNYVYIYI